MLSEALPLAQQIEDGIWYPAIAYQGKKTVLRHVGTMSAEDARSIAETAIRYPFAIAALLGMKEEDN